MPAVAVGPKLAGNPYYLMLLTLAGVYAIIDLHGAPGGQSSWACSGEPNDEGLWKEEKYREQTVAEAKGRTARFLKVYEEYQKAPDVTRRRMYLETMERVLGGMDKIILDEKSNASSVIPYLPLGEMQHSNQAGGQR